MLAKTNLTHYRPAAMQSSAKPDFRLQLLLERSVECVNIGCHQRHRAERLTTNGGRLAASAKDREHCVPEELVWQAARLHYRELTALRKRLTTNMLSNGNCAAASFVESRISTNMNTQPLKIGKE